MDEKITDWIRIGDVFSKASFDQERLILDLEQQAVSVFTYVASATLYDAKTPDDHQIVEVIGSKFLEVYQHQVLLLYFTKAPIKDNYLKTDIPFDEFLNEGKYYVADRSLDSFSDIFIRKDDLEFYRRSASQDSYEETIEVWPNWQKIQLPGQNIISLNSDQALILEYLYNDGTVKSFQREDISLIPNLKMIGTGESKVFDFANIFKKNSPQRDLVKIHPGRNGIYSIADIFRKTSIKFRK